MHLARKTKHSILLNCLEVLKNNNLGISYKKLESVHSAFELKQASLFKSDTCKIQKDKVRVQCID